MIYGGSGRSLIDCLCNYKICRSAFLQKKVFVMKNQPPQHAAADFFILEIYRTGV